jgi:hypothetical protein
MQNLGASRRAAVALLLLLGSACISTKQAVRPGGDDAVVTFSSGASHRVELLAVTQDDLYCLRGQRVWRYPLADLSSVHVEGYSLRRRKLIPLGFAGVADAAIGAALIGLGVWPLAVLPAALFVVGAYTSLDSEPRTGFGGPLTDSARVRLALYCRYPRGLADRQWRELMNYCRQDEFLGPDQPSH